MRLGAAFDSHFVSHLTGRIKPDRQAFEHVLQSLGCRPAQVLFFDDNLLNIEAARTLGMHAVQVRGLVEAQRALIELEILDGT
jgi:putative hydrolase of the HAD superfamily